MIRTMRSVTAWILAIGAFGCGSGDPLGVGVSGTVSYKGVPIKEGTITFVPIGGTVSPQAGANIDDGKYSIPRRGALSPGKYRVEILAFEDSGKESSKGTQQAQMFGRPLEKITSDPVAADQLQKARTLKKNVLPARYNTDSELTRELPDQSQFTIDFEL